MSFPDIDPIIFQIGPFALRWYALAYIAGLLMGMRYMMMMSARPALWPSHPLISQDDVSDLLLWVVLGVILGGRLGYVLFYNPAHYLAHPQYILAVWQGGMSFHGGASGVFIAVVGFAYKRQLDWRALADMTSATAPIGLFFGRLANFINSELWGRTTDVPWAIVFPNGGPEPRHPSQLYEAALEGALLFTVFAVVFWRFKGLSRAGLLTGLFCLIYGASRFFIEFFRQPDAHIGFIWQWLTMGQLLCLPFLLIGLGFILTARPR